MSHFLKKFLAVSCAVALASCASKDLDTSRPTENKPKTMSERMSEGEGYKQDEDGNWVPKSDKRSSFDSKRESAYFKGKIEKNTYKTGEYAKKSWWGSKEYEKKSYEGNTDGSRFKTAARQQGQKSRADGQKADLAGSFKTNTLDRKSARESQASAIPRTVDASVESRRSKYIAPSVIDWREQRTMSVDQSRGILGR